MASPFFTVIMSGYQNEPYLPKALASIAGQTFSDFEAICYVEESTDNSLAICQHFAENDQRFKVVSAPKSGGVSSTRNYGIEHAEGEYLVVIDGDDWVVTDMLEKLHRKLQENQPLDVLSFAALATSSDDVDSMKPDRTSIITNFKPEDAAGVFSGPEAIRRSMHCKGKFNAFTWLSIYRTDFLRAHHIRQAEGKLMEDVDSTPRIWFFAQRFAYMDEVLYLYRKRPQSITANKFRCRSDMIWGFHSLMTFVAQHDIPEDILSCWFNQWIGMLYFHLFYPGTVKFLTGSERVSLCKQLLSDHGERHFLTAVRRTSLQKRLAVPFVSLAACGVIKPAMLFFRLYYFFAERHKSRGRLTAASQTSAASS